MAKTEVTQWDTTAANNLDVNDIRLDENVMRPPAVNNAFREVMAQLRRMLNSTVFRLFDTTDPTKKLAFDLSGLTTATERTLTVPNASGTLVLVNEGTYTPTGTAGANCAAVGPFLNYYYRIGSRITCWGLVTCDPSLATTSTTFDLSLPVPSNLANSGELAGVFDSGVEHGRILGEVTNNRATFTYVSATTAATNFAFQFSYIVI